MIELLMILPHFGYMDAEAKGAPHDNRVPPAPVLSLFDVLPARPATPRSIPAPKGIM